MAFFSAIEPLRVANRMAGTPVHRWHILSRDGAPVEASNGMSLPAENSIDDAPPFATLIVCASFEPHLYIDTAVLKWLRALDRQGADLGSLDTGCYLLARAGSSEARRGGKECVSTVRSGWSPLH